MSNRLREQSVTEIVDYFNGANGKEQTILIEVFWSKRLGIRKRIRKLFI